MKYLNTFWGYIKAHWFTVLALLMVLWSVDKPYVMAFVSTHPLAAVIYANIVAVVTFYLKSPFNPNPPNQGTK